MTTLPWRSVRKIRPVKIEYSMAALRAFFSGSQSLSLKSILPEREMS
ncbi:MAG: hypothetical protein HW408_495 [Actinobacteria bacterium]|nr:hypothetical protein [Actinomycetota bacterium]